MPKTIKASRRDDVRFLQGRVDQAEGDMEFWFRHRINVITGERDLKRNWAGLDGDAFDPDQITAYDYCRARFQEAKKDRKFYMRMLSRATRRYLKSYKG